MTLIHGLVWVLSANTYAQNGPGLSFNCITADEGSVISFSAMPNVPFRIECALNNMGDRPIQIQEAKASGCTLKPNQQHLQNPVPRDGTVIMRFDCQGYKAGTSIANQVVISLKNDSRVIRQTYQTFFTRHAGCSDVQLDQSGGSAEKVKKDWLQGTSSCQTHSALILYDAWRFSKNPNDLRSSRPGPSFLEQCKAGIIDDDLSGKSKATLEFLMTNPPCASRPESSKSFAGGSREVDKFELFLNDVDRFTQQSWPVQTLTDSTAACAKRNAVEVDLASIRQLAHTFDDASDFIRYINVQCPPEDRLKAPNYAIDASENPEINADMKIPLDDWQKGKSWKIHDCLDKNGIRCQPFSISFCAEVTEPGFFKPKKDYRCSRHAVTVIGRRYNEKRSRCEFKLLDFRNGEMGNSASSANGAEVWVDSELFMAGSYRSVQLKDR